MNRAGKRTTRLEERACRFKAVPSVEIKLITIPSGGSTIVRAGSVIDLPGGARFRLPRSGLAGALIVLLQHFYREDDRMPHLPDPRKEIVRQAAQGKRFIAVNVPWKIEEDRAS